MKKTVCSVLCIIILVSVFFKCKAVSAQSYAVINGDTGETVLCGNASARLPMASTTKIMTAYILCESVDDFDKTVTVTKQAVLVEGTSMGLKAGDIVSYRQLLYGMLLASGNDAANAAAIAISGSIPAFVERMNEKAAELMLNNTHFATPSGLDGDGHYTTATDLALLTKAALDNKDFAAACSTKSITLSFGSPEVSHTYVNHNRLLREYDDIIGVKTGYTSKAGRCLVTAAKDNDKYIICVTLNDRNDWQDHRDLINSGYELLEKNAKVINESRILIPTAYGDTVYSVVPRLKYYSLGDKLTVKTVCNSMLYPPVKKGDEIGTAYYYYENKCIKRISLCALNDVDTKNVSCIKRYKNIFKIMLFSI